MTDVRPQILGRIAYDVSSVNGSAGTFFLDAAGDRFAMVVQMPQAMTISAVAFRTFSGSGTPPTYKITLEGVDASGDPDGTDVGGGSATLTTFAGFVGAALQEITLSNTYAAVRGEFIAIVIEHSSGTIDGSNRMRVGTADPWLGDRPGCPYSLTDADVAAWTKTNTFQPNWGLNDGTNYVGTISQGATANYSDTVEAGLNFTLPAGMGDTFQVVGATIAVVTSVVTAQSLHLALYDDAASPALLQSITVDSDINAAIGSVRAFTIMFDEATLATLNFGTAYVLSVSHSGGGTKAIQVREVASAGAMDQFPYGTAWFLSERSQTAPPEDAVATAWSDTLTERPEIYPIINDLTEPAGGGGGVKMAGRGGGMAG